MQRLKTRLSKISEYPAHEILSKGANFVRGRIHDRLKKVRDLQRKSTTAIPPNVNSKSLPEFDLTALHVLDLSDDYLAEAEQICAHEFDLLGSGLLQNKFGISCPGFAGHCYESPISAPNQDLEFWLAQRLHPKDVPFACEVYALIDKNYQPIDWQRDFKSGYRWSEQTWYKDIACISQPGVDIKVPWELARMQHLPRLAIAGAVAEAPAQAVLAAEFRNQILDFIATNPVAFGANWNCSMEIAIRACNWIFAWQVFRSAGRSFDAQFEQIFQRSLYFHGKHIFENLERTATFANNHYLSNIVGLLFIALFFQQTGECKIWYEFAIGELKREISHQFYADGTNFEASTTYHKLSLEMVFFAVQWAVRHIDFFNEKNHREVAGFLFGWPFVQQLHAMFDATIHLLQPDGQMPQIGDNDSGQFFGIYPRSSLETVWLLNCAAVFFQEEKWKIKEFAGRKSNLTETALFFGQSAVERWQKMRPTPVGEIPAKVFPNSGWAILRSRQNYCLITAGPNGQDSVGGHSHNDKLSFTLICDGQPVIVDPGTFIYTAFPDQRDRFRSVKSHNTVIIDDHEQNRIISGDLFRLPDKSAAKILKFTNKQNIITILAEHTGYTNLKQPVVHRRKFQFYKKSARLKIVDYFSGEGKHQFEWRFHIGNDFVDRISLKSSLNWQKVPAKISSGYGMISNATQWLAQIEATVSFRIMTEIRLNPEQKM